MEGGSHGDTSEFYDIKRGREVDGGGIKREGEGLRLMGVGDGAHLGMDVPEPEGFVVVDGGGLFGGDAAVCPCVGLLKVQPGRLGLLRRRPCVGLPGRVVLEET